MEILKVASTDWTDEYSVNILDENNHLIAKTVYSPYTSFEQAALNAQLIVAAVNNWPTLKEKIFQLRQIEIKCSAHGDSVTAYNEILSLMDKIESGIIKGKS